MSFHHSIDTLPRRTVLSLPLVSATARDTVRALLATGRRRVAFVNAHCANVAARDAAYRGALRSADMVLPDGAGIALAARLAGQPLAANLNGTDLMPDVLAHAARRGLSVFLLGARPGVAAEAADALRDAHAGLRIVGHRHGFGDEAGDIAAINASGADILIVAKGVPEQDLWLARNAARLDARIQFGVGAFLDFASGRVTRAPRPVRAARMEWAWRLMREPRRLAGRYLLGNPAFVARALASAAPDLARRTLDATAAATGLALLSPILLAVACAIRLGSPGPALFRQTRIGQDGASFTMYKFRSMRSDAETRLAEIRHLSEREGGCFKSKADPRITGLGRWLRRYSVDELPQLINVLRGDMSLVGPRPALPAEVAATPGLGGARLSVRPGITGIWQVSGRAEICVERMIEMDSAYALTRSLALDLSILARTAGAVIGGRGAY
ncbi:WecB/TagA/CpsF family glycosyltransferase [Jannaschia sp.]|nr:WecB/TagA/CpsF family glycosyltransferase [Jannaschia sp.]